MLLTSLPPENYRLLPPLEAPAGYICLIRDMEYGDQYCLHLAHDPSGIDDTLNSVAFEVRLARIFGVEADAASAKAELLQRFNSEDEWFTLSPDQLRDLDRLARPARRRSDETQPNPRSRPERSQPNPRPRPERSQPNPRSRPERSQPNPRPRPERSQPNPRPRPERSQPNPRPRPERSQPNPRPRPPEISQRNPSQRRLPLNLILIALILLVIGAMAEEANGTISGIMERLAASAAIPTASPSNTPLPSATATATDAPSKTPAPSATATDAPSKTPLPSATATATDAPSKTPLPSATATATDAPSNTPLPSATATATDAPSKTPLPSATATATDAPSKTPLPSATATATDAPSKTPLPSATATATPSDVPPQIYFIETVQNVNANIRACPRTSCGLVGKLAAGAEVEVTGTVSGETVYGSDVWLQINFKDGSAYLHSELAEQAN